MNREFERDSEKALVPVRKRKLEKEAEQEIDKEPRLIEQWQIPRRWRVY